MSQRTFDLVGGPFADVGGNLLTGQNVVVTLGTLGGVNAEDGSGKTLISKRTVTGTTDGSGNLSITLEFPGDFTSPLHCWYTVNLFNKVITSPIDFSYASSIDVETWDGAPPAAGTLPVYTTLETADEAGVANTGAHVYLNVNGIGTNNVIYSANRPVNSTSDGSGKLIWNLTPNANINPSASTYRLTMDGEPSTFTFTVPTTPTGYQGAYDGGTTYHVNAGTKLSPSDVVLESGVLYQAIADTTGHTPPNATYWIVWPGEPLAWHLTQASGPATVQISADNVLHDADLNPPPPGAPNQSPVSIADDIGNLAYLFDDSVTGVGAVDEALLSTNKGPAWGKLTGIASFVDPTAAVGDILYRNPTSVTSLVIGFMGDDLMTYNTHAIPSAVLSALSTDGVTITGSFHGVNSSKSADWIHSATNYTTALTAFAAATVRVVVYCIGMHDSRVSVATSAASYYTNVADTVSHLVAAGYIVLLHQPIYTVPGSDSNDFTSASNNLLIQYQAKLNVLVDGSHVIQGDTLGYKLFSWQPTELDSGLYPNAANGQTDLANLWTTPTKRAVQALVRQTVQQRLAIGGSGQVLTVSGGLPTWSNASSGSLPTLGRINQTILSDGTEAAFTTPSTIASMLDVTTADGDIIARNHSVVTSLVIGFIGDSISLDTYTIPAGTCTALSVDGVTVTRANQAVTGTSTSDWGTSSTNYTTAIAAFAGAGVRIVSVMLGTNDARAAVRNSAATYRSQLQTMVNDLVRLGYIVVLHYSPYAVPGSDAGDQDATANTLRIAYQAEIDAMINGSTILQGDTNAYNYFFNNGSHLSDGIHPDTSGQAEFAALWASALQGAVSNCTQIVTLKPVHIGSTGQSLTVAGGQPTWANPGAMSTKGDLLGFTTVPARVAVGTDGYVLVADSTQTSGVRWSAGAGGHSYSVLTDGNSNIIFAAGDVVMIQS